MQNWTYELNVPDDTTDEELDGYRELAISTWRTGAECMGGAPGDPAASLVEIAPVTSHVMGDGATFNRVWRIEGPVT